jgi:nucleotide-binding universal stress UspA family protein
MSHHASRILVGVDFSAESDAAIGHALAIARAKSSEVFLLHACTVPEPPAALNDYALPSMGELRARLEADVTADKAKLSDVATRFAAEGVKVTPLVADGFPDTTITQIGHDLAADLTIVGSHGRSGLKWLLLGSVAQRVVRLAESDVLVARGAAGHGGYRRVCVATDFSPIAGLGLEAALDLAHLGAEVEVVHFWHMTTGIGLYEISRMAMLDGWRGPVEHQLAEAGERLIAEHRRPGVSMSFRAIFEPVLPGALELIEREGYDLTVLGSHGRRGFRRFVLGSTAEEVARRAKSSVLVVHGAAAERVEAAA